jgi:hypothetical protein
VVTRRNDENAMPARQAGRAAAKAAVTHAAVKPGFEAPGKVGAKRERNVLGAVTNVRVCLVLSDYCGRQ